jgi:hypothetical protein
MTEEIDTNLYKFKFEYVDSEESKYVRKMYGDKYLQETNEEIKTKLEILIVKLYHLIEVHEANYDRYIKLKTNQYVLSEEDITKAKDIIRETFAGKKARDGTEFYNDEDFLNREITKIKCNINLPRLGYNGKTHFGPLYSYSTENLNKLYDIFGRRFSAFKWISNEKSEFTQL